MVANQRIITGPNTLPIVPVPALWTPKSATTITTASGTTKGSKRWVTISSPSTAPKTVIAGVIMPSP